MNPSVDKYTKSQRVHRFTSSLTLMNTLANIPLLIGLKVMMDKNMNIPLNDEHLSSYINKISVYL